MNAKTMLPLFLVLLVPACASAADYYVAKTGCSDGYSGTEAQPWCTVGKAVSTAAAGDTVYIKNGTYNEMNDLARSGSPGNPITFRNYPDHSPIVDGTGFSDAIFDWSGAPGGKADWIVLDGLEIRNFGNYGVAIRGNNNTIQNCNVHTNYTVGRAEPILIAQGDYNKILRNRIHDSGWNALNVQNANYTEIAYNDIYDAWYHGGVNVMSNTGAYYGMMEGNDIHHNYVHDTGQGAIYLRYQQNNKIYNNLIILGTDSNDHMNIYFSYGTTGGAPSRYVANTRIYNNVIIGGRWSIFNDAADNLIIKNNIIKEPAGTYFVNMYSTTLGHVIDYNLYNGSGNWNMGGTYYTSLSGLRGAGYEQNGLVGNPAFVNEAGRDFSINPASEATDMGQNLLPEGVTDDFAGTPRPQGPDWDIGAYEYVPTSAVFYVDPDYGESTRNGSASNPWISLASQEWTVIDAGLAGSDVTVYFSAKNANNDSNQISGYAVNVLRNDNSSHRVTLDGMSKYNANDMNPVWLGSTGPYKLEIRYGYPIGTGNDNRSYVTLRGFKPIGGWGGYGGQAIYYNGGNHVVIEYNDVSHSPDVTHGSLFQYGYAHRQSGGGNGGCTDIVIRNNVFHDSGGECLYFGGSENTGLPAHSNVLIEGNIIYNCGIYGPEGDCIDIKDENTNVTIMNNYCFNMTGGNAEGISSTGSAVRVEGNVVHNANKGIAIGTYWGRQNKGSIITGNILYNNFGDGIKISDDTDNPTTDVLISGNTVFNNAGNGITLGENADGLNNITIKNNIIANNIAGIGGWGTIPVYYMGYNDVYGNNRNYESPFPDLSGQYGNIVTNPLFLDTGNPIGQDGIWFTDDDGFVPQHESSVCRSGEGEVVMGALTCGPGQAYHPSDTNQNGCVETSEMIAFMDRWKLSVADVNMPEMMESIGLWKSGEDCS
jgi:hypothetical protein